MDFSGKEVLDAAIKFDPSLDLTMQSTKQDISFMDKLRLGDIEDDLNKKDNDNEKSERRTSAVGRYCN